MEALKEELKNKIITTLNLEDIAIEDIADNDPLFGDGLGLDSIDALELIVILDKDYGIKLVDPKEGKTIFQSIETMAAYISANRTSSFFADYMIKQLRRCIKFVKFETLQRFWKLQSKIKIYN